MLDKMDPQDPEKAEEYQKLQDEISMNRYLKRQQAYRKIIERDCYGYSKAKKRRRGE